MQDQDIINEEERHEAATEEPTTVGCPSLGPKVLPSGFDGVDPEDGLPKLVKKCASTPQTIVFETIRPSGLKLAAEWEAEDTGHSAQAFLYHGDKCVCQIRFFNTFQSRNLGRQITRHALNGLVSVVGHAKRNRENNKAKNGGLA